MVDGHVQGVFYRATTIAKANELGLAGWVRNLPDGRVELVMQGPHDKVDSMEDWLWEGSPASRVSSVQCEDARPENYKSFSVSR